jgi:cytochrome oxidase Cu insertion factor (SCO1/SenC/PrrC family)
VTHEQSTTDRAAGSDPATPTTARTPRHLVTLLAIASIGTTALVAINVVGRHGEPTEHPIKVADPAPVDANPLRGGLIDATPDLSPPVLATLEPFSLTDSQGNAFGSRQLRGKVWVADFIFTRCAGPCPMMTSRMAQLQARLAQAPTRSDARLVSISVDPTHDSPEVLRRYASMAEANPHRWRFLTGGHDETWRLAQDGFKLPVANNPEDTRMPILHSQKFVLVDRAGLIRGYYDGLDDTGFDQLLGDLDRVLAGP